MNTIGAAAAILVLASLIAIMIIAFLVLPLESSVKSSDESARTEIVYDTNQFGRGEL